jgi:hypothetical protein
MAFDIVQRNDLVASFIIVIIFPTIIAFISFSTTPQQNYSIDRMMDIALTTSHFHNRSSQKNAVLNLTHI